MGLIELIARAPWREAVTYRDTWPHEYVVIKKDGQEELLATVCKRFCDGEGVDGRFFRMKNKYLFIGDYKYWLMTPCTEIDLDKVFTDKDDYVLNRALIYRGRRDFFIKDGDDGRRDAEIDGVFDIKPSEYNKGAKADNRSLTGKLQNVPVKGVWPDEARDFTPWLAENLDLLGEVLLLDLEEIQQEAPTGDFRLDILARDRPSGAMVAIENQLEWTDDGHLGQTLTYAGWHDAHILIWVAPYFTQRHRDALEWLNRWTPYEIEAYGVEVSAVKIGYSKPAPVFEPVVLPRAWYARREAGSAGLSMIGAKRKGFFQPLVDKLYAAGLSENNIASAREYQLIPTETPGITFRASIEGNKAWVYIGGDSTYAAPSQITDGLRDGNRSAMEEALGLEEDSKTKIVWETGRYTRNIGVWREGSIDDSEVELEEIRQWMFDYMFMFKKVFNPRIKAITAEMREAEDAD